MLVLTKASLESSSPESHLHTVKQGESWYSISDRYGVSIDELYQVNGVSSRNKMLYVDSRIIVPVAAPTSAPLAPKGLNPGDSVALYVIGATAAATAAVTLLVIKLKDKLQGLRYRRQAVAVVQPPEEDRRRRDENGMGPLKSRMTRELSDDDEEYHYPLTDGYWVKHPSATNGAPSASTFVWGSHSSNPFFTQQTDQQQP